MTLKELKEQRDKLDKEIEELEEAELMKRQKAVSDKIDSMSDKEKQFILDNLNHVCSSCDNGFDYHINGWSDIAHKFSCPKCMLMEILNGEHGGRFDFKFSVDILEV